MKLEPIIINNIKIRSILPEDATKAINHNIDVNNTTTFMNKLPEETNTDIEKEKIDIQDMLDSERSAYLGLFVDDSLVATAGLFLHSQRAKLKHRAGLGLSVGSSYRGKGYGKIILTETLNLAKSLGYEQVELEVVSTNFAGIKLYSSLGFKKIGKLDHAYKLNGEYLDFDLMVKYL